MVDINPSILVIPFNVSDLNGLKEFVRMDQIALSNYKDADFQNKDTYRLKVNRWRKINRLALIKKHRSSYMNFR